MAIRKRGKSYQVRVRPFPEQSVPTKEAAILVEADLKRRKALGELHREKPETFGQVLDAHEARKLALGGTRGKLRPATARFYAQSKQGWAPLRDMLIPNLRRSIVEDHVAARAKAAPVAARNELQFCKAALRSAEARGQMVDRGIFGIQPVRHESVEGRALELEELDSIAAWMPDHVKRIVPLVGTLGLRWSEAVNLDESMLDLKAARLTIPRGLNKSRREKPVPLAAVEVKLLREQLLARTAGTTLVFPTLAGSVYSESGFRKVFSRACTRAGLEGFRFHWLRHTACSLMARAGMSPEVAAQRVGHSDGGALIFRRYRHLYPSEISAAVGLIDELVKGAGADGSGQDVVSGG